jgi:arylsulfatase A-like enzyme
LTTALGDEAANFVKRHKDKPWLLYLPFNAPHTPHEPSAQRLAKFSHIRNLTRRKYLAQLSLLDDAIGSVLTALNVTSQRQRTLIFFFSDNGGHTDSGSNNTPLRGIKGSLFEGGVRVPFLVSWPEKLPAGVDYTKPVSSVDVLATSLAAAGIAMPKDQVYDSVNLVPHLSGAVNAAPHDRLFWRMHGKQLFAMREGKWKLIRLKDQAVPVLYDLESDMAETKDCAAENSEIVKKMQQALDDWCKQLVNPVFPGSSIKNEDWGPGGANQKAREK